MTYDWRDDALKCWQLAIAEKRKRGLLDGHFEPRNQEEQQLVDGKNDGNKNG